MTEREHNGISYADAAGPVGVRIFAIGDVHGRLDLLAEMHRQIKADVEASPSTDWRIIHLGDYVDRGTDSKGVIDFLLAAQAGDKRHIALAGNHDAGFKDFLDKPDGGSLFARFGGAETALSYGVERPRFDHPDTLMQTWAALRSLVPGSHYRLLNTLPRSCSFGDFFFCHAGIRPEVGLDQQDENDLMWIRNQFLKWPHLHEKVIVHGHTPHSQPEVLPNRVNVDTEAWRSGVLTALVIDESKKRIMQVGV